MSFPPSYTTAGEGAKPHLKLWKSKESCDELWTPSPYVSLGWRRSWGLPKVIHFATLPLILRHLEEENLKKQR